MYKFYKIIDIYSIILFLNSIYRLLTLPVTIIFHGHVVQAAGAKICSRRYLTGSIFYIRAHFTLQSAEDITRLFMKSGAYPCISYEKSRICVHIFLSPKFFMQINITVHKSIFSCFLFV